ncbi:MAG: AI-2E family transporter [Gammaproteobacteria bacterium]|nr:MAG: AI-2E family transporter [Gammaproteobacteria bacterium]
MQLDTESVKIWLSTDLTDTLIRLAIVAVLVVLCVRIFEPFLGLMLWALILAVALYPAHQWMVRRFAMRQGRAATLLVLISVLAVGVPGFMLGGSFASQVYDFHARFKNDEITIKKPDPAVAEWPLVGKKVYASWSQAAEDLPAYLAKIKPQLTETSKKLAAVAASTAGGVFKFLGSMIIAGIMLAYGKAGSQSMQRIMSRLAGPERGVRLHSLSTATIRSVATGVVGVAFIQALLLGVGFIWAGIPAAGVWALVVLLFGIAQLPAAIVTLPAIAYIWWTGDSTMLNVVFSVYLIAAGLADNVLKPLLLGRGVDAPMPVILLGALGGMVSGGIVGLFIGAVVMAIGYQVFMDWVAEADQAGGAQGEAAPEAE